MPNDEFGTILRATFIALSSSNLDRAVKVEVAKEKHKIQKKNKKWKSFKIDCNQITNKVYKYNK